MPTTIRMRRFIVATLLAALPSSALSQIVDGFETYPDGPLAGQGGWTIYYAGGNNGMVVSGAAHGGSKYLRAIPGTDLVQQPVINGGLWTCTVWTYMPNGAGDAYFIMANQYGNPSFDNTSIQIRLSAGDGVVESQYDFAELPIIVNQWVELRAEIDLAADAVNTFYNGTPLGVNLSWRNNVTGGGRLQIRAIDLYSATSNGFRWDDLSLQDRCACDGDVNGSGAVDFSDLTLFLSSFGLAAPNIPSACADIDGDGAVDQEDLAVMLSRFGIGC